MKRTLLIAILAMAPVVSAPLTVAAQENPEAAPVKHPAGYKYEVYAGFAYTSLNQVNLSRYGLVGGKIMVTRDFGQYVGLMATGDYYKPPIRSGREPNPGNPSVYSFMVGPELHAQLYEKLSGLVLAELGGEHTGGENMSPSISLAGGFGVGMTYKLTDRLAVRAIGDRVAGSFSLTNNNPILGYSTHMTWNPRATFGVVYKF